MILFFSPSHDCLQSHPWHFPLFSEDFVIWLIVSLSPLNPVISLVEFHIHMVTHFSNTSSHFVNSSYGQWPYPPFLPQPFIPKIVEKITNIYIIFSNHQQPPSLLACFLNYSLYAFYLILSLPIIFFIQLGFHGPLSCPSLNCLNCSCFTLGLEKSTSLGEPSSTWPHSTSRENDSHRAQKDPPYTSVILHVSLVSSYFHSLY